MTSTERKGSKHQKRRSKGETSAFSHETLSNAIQSLFLVKGYGESTLEQVRSDLKSLQTPDERLAAIIEWSMVIQQQADDRAMQEPDLDIALVRVWSVATAGTLLIEQGFFDEGIREIHGAAFMAHEGGKHELAIKINLLAALADKKGL